MGAEVGRDYYEHRLAGTKALIYILVFFVLAASCFLSKQSAQLRKLFYWAVLIGLFLFSAFRFEVGCDWTGYLNQFYVYGIVPLSDTLSMREPMWVALFSIQNRLGFPYPWINVASSFIFFAGAHAMAKRQINPLSFLVLLYPILIINMPMSGIRQGAAIGIMFFAFNAFSDKAVGRYIMLVLISASLHQSALIFLLLTPLVNGAYSSGRIVWALGMAIPGIFYLLTSSAAEIAFTRYIDSGGDAAGAVFRVSIGALTGIYFLIFLQETWRVKYEYDFKIVHIGSVAMLAITLALPISTIIADRIEYYLVPIQAIIFSRVPSLISGRISQLQAAAPYFGLFVMLFVWISYSSHVQSCYLPYQSWLFGL